MSAQKQIIDILKGVLASAEESSATADWLYADLDQALVDIKELSHFARSDVARAHASKPAMLVPEGYVHPHAEVEVTAEVVAEAEVAKEEPKVEESKVEHKPVHKAKAKPAAENNNE